jgi:hypothetical protein
MFSTRDEKMNGGKICKIDKLTDGWMKVRKKEGMEERKREKDTRINR